MNLRTKLVENALDDGSIGASGGEDELAHVEKGVGLRLGCGIWDGVGKSVLATIDEVIGHGVVETLGIAFGQILGEDVVAGRGETIRAHAAIVAVFVGGLAR